MSESVVEVNGFAQLGLDPRLLNALGYKDPSPIQREAIPVLLEGKDLIGLAGTGTGKTAAFALPILHQLRTRTKKHGVAALILTPTRELAIQVARAVKTYGKPVKVEVAAVYGGTGYTSQIQAIRRGVEIIVATPGRALDLIKRNKLPLDAVTTVVLDEADEMLNMGFAEDMEAILSQTPKERQTMLFSATMPPRIEEMANKHLRNPVRIKVAKERPASGEAARVRQTAFLVTRENKAGALGRILDFERPASAIIFCRTRSDVDGLADVLANRGSRPLALHGGLTQEQRDQVMARFRSGTADLLIATDIAARGLDIAQLSHVINFDLPTDVDQYIHRIGRVGRAGRAGVAITFVTAREQRALLQIERATRQRIDLVPVPTVKDLRASRLDRTRQQLREALTGVGATDELRKLVEELAKEFSPTDVAVAALALLHPPGRPEDKAEFASAPPAREVNHQSRSGRNTRDERTPRGPDVNQSRPNRNSRDERAPVERRPNQSQPRQNGTTYEEKPPVESRPAKSGMMKIHFGIGREAGVKVRDLIETLENEAGLPSKDVGNIELNNQFALVEVPGALADYIVEVMQGVRIRRRKFNVRIDRPKALSTKSGEQVSLPA